MLVRLGVRGLLVDRGEKGFESLADPAEVSPVGGGPVTLECERRAWRDDMHKFRHAALRRRHQLSIDAQLQDRCTLGATCQLRIDHFVRPISQGAWLLNAQQNVCAAAPAFPDKPALDDDVYSPEAALEQCF